MSATKIKFHSRTLEDVYVHAERLGDVLSLLNDIEWTPVVHTMTPDGTYFIYYRGKNNQVEMLEVFL